MIDLTKIPSGQIPIVHFDRAAPGKEPSYVLPALPEGRVGLLCGSFGVGKSYLSMELAMSVAGGVTLIPGLDVNREGKVGLFHFSPDRDDLLIRQRGSSILKTFPTLSEAKLKENLSVYSVPGEKLVLLNDKVQPVQENIDWLKDKCKGMRLAILDPLSHLHMINENSENHMSILIGILTVIAKETGASILVAHCTDEIETVNAARVILTLSKFESDKKSKVLKFEWAKLNHHAPIKHLLLEQNKEGVLVLKK